MKQGFLAAVLVVALTACTTHGADEPEVTTLPEVTLKNFDGPGETTLSDLKGPLVVNLWASWCGPCRDEMPLLEEFSQKYEGRVDVLGIDFEDPQVEAAKDLVEESGVTYDLLTDPQGDVSATPPFPPISRMPFLAFVDKDGTVVHTEFVVVDQIGDLEKMVEEHLGVQG
ncbi:MAG: TlpA disulfide reductase family protein [Nocardioides sp.]|jgi:cytochrome c biogenesis protein CcmG/thiol:disulfide interchange protein DsbE